jgi:hypothetical protein
VLLSAGQYPTLLNPEGLFFHLLIWAGAPAAGVAFIVWLLGLFQSAKGWVDLAASIASKYRIAVGNIQEIISARKRAAVRLAVCSALVVGFSYMLAVIINVLVRVAEMSSPDAIYSSKAVENTIVATEWSPVAAWTMIAGVVGIGLFGFACITGMTGLRKLIMFLGGVACVAAWVTGATVAAGTVMTSAGLALGGSNPPPKPLLATEAIVAVLLLAIGYLLPGISKASRLAFNAP